MAGEQVFKDVADIYSRLFNHKAALQGLNQNFVKEFEEKRDETLLLSRSLEGFTECNQNHLPAVQETLASHLGNMQQAVEAATKSCQQILQDEAEKKTEWLSEERHRRAAEKQNFIDGQAKTARERADAEFELRADGLRKHYADLEEKLSLSGTRRVL